ncbi:hypothetical protein WJX81_007598 [Elliptochloris bilobata]|uniref:Conserved oligomeric Golgi complex subunit 8 n=1 Tax=Elliptochloris bilobata TaxID=381761 RepID=A0AAW1QZZ2_9CHLO
MLGRKAHLCRQMLMGRSGSTSAAAPLGTYASPAEREQAEAYFSDLLSYSLERLSKEPELLRADQDQLRRQAQDSAVAHYHAFIEMAAGLDATRVGLAGVAGRLEALAGALPSLAAASERFTAAAQDISAQRARAKQLHRQQGALLELLEVPQLLDACARGGAIEEALDLRAFVARASLLHPDLQVVRGLVAEVEAASTAMLEALLARLRAAVQLPECLRIVGHLRRLAVFPEAELRRRFLQCREEWLAELVAELDERSVYDYLKRLTDVHRLQLFDVVMQYRAIFADDALPADGSTAGGGGDGAGAGDGGALFSWAEHRVVAYLEALRRALPRVGEGGALASVLEHCMYCGMSLGRVGLDFRGLLPPLFEAAALGLFRSSVQVAVDAFAAVLDTHKWVALSSGGPRTRRGAAAAQPPNPNPADAARGEAAPPYALMDHAPMATLTNGLLGAMNELRHCAPLALAAPCAQTLQDALTAAVAAMAHYQATRPLGSGEAAQAGAAAEALVSIVCPYAVACLGRIFPGAAGTFIN